MTKQKRSSILTKTIAQFIIGVLLISVITSTIALGLLSFNLKNIEAINAVNSLQTQSYRLAYDIKTDTTKLPQHIDKLSQTISSPAFNFLNNWFISDNVTDQYKIVQKEWKNLLPILTSQNKMTYLEKMPRFLNTLDNFTSVLHENSKSKLRFLYHIRVVGFISLISLSFFIIIFIQKKIVIPLYRLVAASKAMTNGNYSIQVNLKSNNELGLLSDAFNHMVKKVNFSHQELERRVEEKTLKLSIINRSLKTLYACSQELSSSPIDNNTFKNILDTFVNIEGITNAKLIIQDDTSKELTIISGIDNSLPWKKEQLTMNNQKLGYLLWQFTLPCPDKKLITNIVHILSRAMFYSRAQKINQELLVIEERATIARELHDSLAQALSYLKIQASLLKRQLKQKDKIISETTHVTLNEIDDGIKDAYTQLRELLNTFRLTIDNSNFGEALQEIINGLQTQTHIKIHINNTLPSTTIGAQQHVHLLQLTREAVLNAIKYSKADSIKIICLQENTQGVISIEDDGVGFDINQKRQKHYGLGIMQERANNIRGILNITSKPARGCTVSIKFPLEKFKP